MAYLKFGDTEIAVPTTFTIDKKKIMSDNAGLASTCRYVGDVGLADHAAHRVGKLKAAGSGSYKQLCSEYAGH